MPVDDLLNEGAVGWRYMWNAMWLTFITMTTVGYGDIYPVTTQGKVSCVFACFWGNFVISLIVVTLASLVQFSAQEARSHYQVKKERLLKETYNKAAEMVGNIFK